MWRAFIHAAHHRLARPLYRGERLERRAERCDIDTPLIGVAQVVN